MDFPQSIGYPIVLCAWPKVQYLKCIVLFCYCSIIRIHSTIKYLSRMQINENISFIFVYVLEKYHMIYYSIFLIFLFDTQISIKNIPSRYSSLMLPAGSHSQLCESIAIQLPDDGSLAYPSSHCWQFSPPEWSGHTYE